MPIDWDNFHYFEKALKQQKRFREHGIEKITFLLNLDKLMNLDELNEKIRKIPAFNEYLAFNMVREICHKEIEIAISSINELEYKINTTFDYDISCKLNESFNLYKDLVLSPQKMSWDIYPIFGDLAEIYGLVSHTKTREGSKFIRSPEGNSIVKNLSEGLRTYGILEFYADKDSIFIPIK